MSSPGSAAPSAAVTQPHTPKPDPDAEEGEATNEEEQLPEKVSRVDRQTSQQARSQRALNMKFHRVAAVLTCPVEHLCQSHRGEAGKGHPGAAQEGGGSGEAGSDQGEEAGSQAGQCWTGETQWACCCC